MQKWHNTLILWPAGLEIVEKRKICNAPKIFFQLVKRNLHCCYIQPLWFSFKLNDILWSTLTTNKKVFTSCLPDEFQQQRQKKLAGWRTGWRPFTCCRSLTRLSACSLSFIKIKKSANLWCSQKNVILMYSRNKMRWCFQEIPLNTVRTFFLYTIRHTHTHTHNCFFPGSQKFLWIIFYEISYRWQKTTTSFFVPWATASNIKNQNTKTWILFLETPENTKNWI